MIAAIRSAAPSALPARASVSNASRPVRAARRLLGLTALLSLLAGCGPTSFLITPVSGERRLEEHVVLREAPLATTKIALIDVEGVLKDSRDSSLLGTPTENPVALFKEKLDRAARDSRVKAIVLRINSPGGTVTASDIMFDELRRFKKCTGKPVVTSMQDVAASGGYYIACASDKIYAMPTTITGSIGVIMLLPEVAGTMEKIGMRMRVFKSGEMKDAGSPFREMTPRDREMFDDLIARMYARFFGVVHDGRPVIAEEHLREIANGRVFLGTEAQKEGLVDEVGGVHEALAAAKGAAGLCDQDIIVVEYARPPGYRPNVYARTDQPAPQVNMVNIQLPDWLSSPSPQMMYLWAPGW
jgi:protease IV